MSASPPTPSQVTALLELAATVLPADPPRLSRVAFWSPDGSAPEVPGLPVEEVTVALPTPDGAVAVTAVPAVALPVGSALPALTRARAARTATPAARFWGAAAVLALQLAARGRLLPGVTAGDHDAWRLGPLEAADTERLRALAEAMPPHAHAVPLPEPDTDGGPLLPSPATLLRTFLDAVADGLPRTPAAALAAGSPAFAAREPVRVPERRAWAGEVAAGHDAGVGLSLRMELQAPAGDAAPDEARFRAVLQAHSLADPAVVVDASALWAEDGPGAEHFGPGARRDALLTLRRAAAAWEALSPLLTARVPDALELADEEVGQLLGEATSDALRAAGLRVHWPRDLARSLTTRAAIGPARDTDGDGGGRVPGLLNPDALLAFEWRFAVGETPLTRAELDRLAEAGRPLVRLRDQWVLLAPEELRRARERQDGKMPVGQALGAVLTGRTEAGGEPVTAEATGWLATLRDRLADPERAVGEPVPQPPALRATLRDYQRRGLDWLDRMTSLGLGACLADDMGLGKTVTLIALHLHRQRTPATAGPTLVVAPASLLGNWQREIEKFAPATPVRRFHGSERELSGLAPGAFVLTTYGTMRRDAGRLAEVEWSLLVADEAQHVKNAFSATARQLRTVPAAARVALTGTPVENNLSELWAVLDWTTPGLLGPLTAFRRRYADAAEDGGDPAAAERLARLVRPFLLRRRKSDPGIAPELPPKTETDRAVTLTAEQAGLYEAVVREGLAEVRGSAGVARRGLVLRLLTSLKQICDHPAQYLKEDEPRLAGRSGKLEAFEELVDNVVAAGSSALVFTQYVRMARLLEARLAERGVASLLLHGGTPVARREELVRRFSAGEAPVFLLSLRAAGTGLNLTRAEHVIHFDRWWNPAVEAQATDRAYRIGQDKPVQVHRLIAEGTVEDRIAALLRRKQALADAVLGGGEAALTELDDAALTELVTLRREPAGGAERVTGEQGSER
ncbi:Superfamily II DNA or RNA helicase, SNF2 family [Streptomyces zhaozhouensis]|uniref:Superfamily II DNA or RNA helicase, SNF2 family n=1 Tax=Streptomyces zhaozhouensis TaxID=1300267 RepID=A0A286DVT1_9ACTN|nr:DEAD/DEAH box helicase [Streptomyces zhaozhouensis]SOD62733.1 Superfamily II DNA or RNA helicase, SNF2 family [Streptomyces zhaozhouensis]